MFKMMIMVVLASDPQTPIAMIQHPWDFNDKETCDAFVNDQDWGVRFNKELVIVYPKCNQISEGT